MTFEEFREKLIPIFTPQEIGSLDRQAVSDALDAMTTIGKTEPNGTLTKWDVFRSLHMIARDFIINLIYDIAEDGHDEIMQQIGIDMTPERIDRLIKVTNKW